MNAPLVEPDTEATYTLDLVAEMTGVSTQTILHYQEQGLLSARHTMATEAALELDDETLRSVRRIEHLRTHYEANLAGLKLMPDLLDEVERVQRDLRARR